MRRQSVRASFEERSTLTMPPHSFFASSSSNSGNPQQPPKIMLRARRAGALSAVKSRPEEISKRAALDELRRGSGVGDGELVRQATAAARARGATAAELNRALTAPPEQELSIARHNRPPVPVGRRDIRGHLVLQPSTNIDDVLRLAHQNEPIVRAAMQEVASGNKAVHIPDEAAGQSALRVKGEQDETIPGSAKDDRRLTEKLAEMKHETGKGAEHLGDALGARLYVDNLRAATEALSKLKRKFGPPIEIDNFLARPRETNYAAIHAQFPVGDASFEMQIIPSSVAEVENKGHHLYEDMRDDEVTTKRRAMVKDEAKRLYGEAFARDVARGFYKGTGLPTPEWVKPYLAKINTGA